MNRTGHSIPPSRKRPVWVAAFVCSLLVPVADSARAENSAPFPLDTRSGTRVAGAVESIAYSTEWNHGGSVQVAADGIVLAEAAAPASGEVPWNASEAGAGFHTLTHVSGGETLTATFAVGRKPAAVALAGLAQVYDGTPKPVAVETVPEGLAVAVTYDGSAEVPVGAGTYGVRAVVDDGIWAGGAEGVLEIAKGRQAIEFAEIGVQETTSTVRLDASASSGLPVAYAVEGPAVLDGNTLSFTGVGTVRIVASQAGDANWEAAEAVEREFGVGLAAVTLAGLEQVYDGTPKPVRAETVPEGLAVAVTYDGSGEAPTVAGSYAVRAEVADEAWAGVAEGVLVIAKGMQTISFAPIGTQKTTNTVLLGATASSGLPVSYGIEGPAVLDGGMLSFTDAGTVSVTASQPGDGNWEAAAAVERVFTVKEPVRPVASPPFLLDTRGGIRIARETESISYSTEWNHGESVRVEADGVVLREAAAPASGDVAWNAGEAGAGLHTLVHASGGETLTAEFMVVEGGGETSWQIVTFDANGGACPVAALAFAAGGVYEHFEPATWNLDHTFAGWYDALEGGNRVKMGMTVSDAPVLALYAHWEGPRQIVLFDANGGTCPKQSAKCFWGDNYSGFKIPVRDGFEFLGWFDALAGGSRVRMGTPVTEEYGRTLYAHWGQVLRFDANGGTCKKKSVKCSVGETYTTLATASREGHDFRGWFDAPEGGNRVRIGMEVTAEAERTLYAHWEKASQIVRFDANGGTCKKKSLKCFIGETYTTLATASREGHAFRGWFDAPEGGNRVRIGMEVTAETERTLYAHWEAGAASLSIFGFSMPPRAIAPFALGPRTTAAGCTLWVDTVANVAYEVLWTPSLDGEWRVLKRWIAAEDGPTGVEVGVPAGSSSGFFRLGISSDE